ncbi:hypothetical protein [Micromonospora cathayae]|uniref:GAF domain-containing protein n=1 Tax=Micromonospora cathayae TaxID=3028804 RepID=A0ABY7ZYB3_9ACTN|nr:hypothetical protein [Micromonospora sp. HUAS 3]WDZ87438.1 hypothetical protein PVK37_14015 [Micromonospora sp. HUAS 3]
MGRRPFCHHGCGGASQALRHLLRESHHARPEDLPDLVMRVAPLVDVRAAVIYLVDHRQRWLVPVPGRLTPSRPPVPITGTMAGRSFSVLTSHEVAGSEGRSLWLPLLDGTERLGVLELVGDGPFDGAHRDGLAVFATLLAELLVSRDQYGDALELIRRRAPMRLPAELLRAQLPPLTFATERLVISGLLEPCYDVGGDAFDYAVNGDLAHRALFDAVGHGTQGGLRAAVLAAIALAAYRNARRLGLSLVGTYHHIDDAVRSHDRTGMTTAILAELTDGLPAPETTRRLMHAILDHQNDVLSDDATVLMARWRGLTRRHAGGHRRRPAHAPGTGQRRRTGDGGRRRP